MLYVENIESISDRKAKGPSLALIALLVLLGISRLWVGGYSFGDADHAWQLPSVMAMNGEFQGDYAFSSPPRLSLFFPAVASLARLQPLSRIYLAGYIAASIATVFAIFALASTLLGSHRAALFAVVLLLVKHDVSAGALTWDPRFLPRVHAAWFPASRLWT